MPISPERAEAVQRPNPHLSVAGLSAGYGSSLVVRGISLQVGQGEVAVVLGPNGSGKSTILKAITGQIQTREGRVRLGELDVTNRPSERLAGMGIGYIPQENDVFPALTVHENLLMGGHLLARRKIDARIEETYQRFGTLARLRSMRAGRLSGGERKLLAVGRVLILQPSLLLLDEPTANLSPMATREVLTEHVRQIADAGAAVLLVEQKALQALEIADWAYVLVAGAMQVQVPASELASRADLGDIFLGSVPSVSSLHHEEGA